jgi:LPXTG-motif cell wall-anchored protein
MYLQTKDKNKGLSSWLDVVGNIVGSIFGLNKSDSANNSDAAILLLMQQEQAAQLQQQKQAQTTNWMVIGGLGVALLLGGMYLSKKR